MEYFIKNYVELFKNMYPFYYPDENLLYYTVYPKWSKEEISASEMQDNFFKRFPYIQLRNTEEIRYNFMFYIMIKPFFYTESNTNISNTIGNTFFNANYTCYKVWDYTVRDIIIMCPEFNKYFEFIKTFRYTLF